MKKQINLMRLLIYKALLKSDKFHIYKCTYPLTIINSCYIIIINLNCYRQVKTFNNDKSTLRLVLTFKNMAKHSLMLYFQILPYDIAATT